MKKLNWRTGGLNFNHNPFGRELMKIKQTGEVGGGNGKIWIENVYDDLMNPRTQGFRLQGKQF